MSWDAAVCGYEWNYTHNTNRMVNAAAEAAGLDLDGKTWFDHLKGRTIYETRPFLAAIVAELAAHPDKYRAMNPENGWGSYDSLLPVLWEMRDVRPPPPVSLVWEVWA